MPWRRKKKLNMPIGFNWGLIASLAAIPFLIWLRLLSFSPFIVDLVYIFFKFIPMIVGGQQTDAFDLGMVFLVLPAIFVLSLLLHDLLVVLAAISAKWLLLGRFREGSYTVSNLYLFFFEITFILNSQVALVMRNNAQTILNNLLMKANAAVRLAVLHCKNPWQAVWFEARCFYTCRKCDYGPVLSTATF